MSDFCMYELEDNIWDDFGDSADSKVPCSVDDYGSPFLVLAEGRKKPRHEAIGIDANNIKSHIYLIGEDSMLEKNPWSHTRDGGSPASWDVGSVKDVRNISSENSQMSNNCFNSGNIDSVDDDFCTGDPLLGYSCAADNGLYNYSLNHIPQTENNLSFFNSECDDKESNDLFYGWADIGNFEDVDKMFRNCDSTFGLGRLSNEDDLCWISSSQPTEDSEVALTSDSKLNKVSANQEASRKKTETPLAIATDSNRNDVVLDDSRSTDVNNAALWHLPTLEVPVTNSQKKDELMVNEQANLGKKQAKKLHQSEGKRNRYTENGVSFYHSDTSNQIIDTKHQYQNSSSYPPSTFQQTCIPYTHLNYDQPSDQKSVCQTMSAVKSENNVNPSSSNESSYGSDQAQSLESVGGPFGETSGMLAFDKRGKLQQRQDLHPSFATNIKNGNKPTGMVLSGSVHVQKNEGQSEVKGVANIPAGLDSSNAGESSCVSSVIDDISLEATSFRQLQRVIDQLDIRTKLCIRDSLYRLARSAEQRHICMNPNNGARDEKDEVSQQETEETDKYPGFMDMETDTNPIDRSIAHLLFHRPSDSSVMPQNGIPSYKSHAMIPQPNASQSRMVEKQEETSVAGTDTKVLASDDK